MTYQLPEPAGSICVTVKGPIEPGDSRRNWVHAYTADQVIAAYEAGRASRDEEVRELKAIASYANDVTHAAREEVERLKGLQK